MQNNNKKLKIAIFAASTMDKRFSHLTHVFLDADDTLWENDIYFRIAEDEFAQHMSKFVSDSYARERLAFHQEANIPVYGYGAKTYLLGMMDAAAELCPGEFTPGMYHHIKGIIERLATHRFDFLEEAEQVVKDLAGRYKVVIATKGEMTEQIRKYHLSGLDLHVNAIEVMNTKSESDYRNLAIKMGVEPQNFLMVGNSVRSDIAPVVAMGGWGIHIPYKVTWVHEMMDMPESDHIIELKHISELRDILL